MILSLDEMRTLDDPKFYDFILKYTEYHNIYEALQDYNTIKRAKSLADVRKDFIKKHPKITPNLTQRADGRVEWHCKHGVGHTIYYPEGGDMVHGCDGCCSVLGGENDETNDNYKSARSFRRTKKV